MLYSKPYPSFEFIITEFKKNIESLKLTTIRRNVNIIINIIILLDEILERFKWDKECAFLFVPCFYVLLPVILHLHIDTTLIV